MAPVPVQRATEGRCFASIPSLNRRNRVAALCLLIQRVGDELGLSSPGFPSKKEPGTLSQPVLDSPPFFPTNVHMSLQLRNGATWLPRLFRTFLAVSLR